jgi:hypothetical protein
MEFVDQMALTLHRRQDHRMMHMLAIGPGFLQPSFQANEVFSLHRGSDFTHGGSCANAVKTQIRTEQITQMRFMEWLQLNWL